MATVRQISDKYTLYNESNTETLKKLPAGSIDLVLTSPFYNTNAKASNGRTLIIAFFAGATRKEEDKDADSN